MKTFHTFKTLDGFKKYLHTKHEKCTLAGKYGGCLDYVKVNGTLYTMQEYDHAGQTIIWGNKKKGVNLEMVTADRYKLGYNDAKVYEYDTGYMRDDIQYAQ